MIEELKAALAERDDAIAGRLGGIEKLLKEHGEKWNALEELQARGSSPGKTAKTRATREHRARFEAWLRRPRDSHTKQELENFERIEGKAVQISTQADGGFAVPEEIAQQIERLELKLSPVRNLVKVMKIGSSDFKHLVDIRGAAAGWVGESGTRSETATSQLREIAPTMGELYAYPQTTEWALDDMFFDVGAWLAESAAVKFARAGRRCGDPGQRRHQADRHAEHPPPLTTRSRRLVTRPRISTSPPVCPAGSRRRTLEII
jgi:HK97 family phage major capsid protein